MAKKKEIELTDDLLTLMSMLNFGELPNVNSDVHIMNYGLDINSLFGGNFLFDDIAIILGMYEEHVDKSTIENPLGATVETDKNKNINGHAENYFHALASIITENIEDLERLIHQYLNRGGLTPGVYQYRIKSGLWTRVRDIDENTCELEILRKKAQ